ncbi:MAG: spore coat protein [Bacillota bacterium]|nr:spore coat protein [Bacillota bacterium]
MKNGQFEEKEWAGNLLYLQKMEATMLCTTVTESACTKIRDHAFGILNRALQNQKALFDLMNSKGWYKIEAAPMTELNRIQQTFANMQSQMQ